MPAMTTSALANAPDPRRRCFASLVGLIALSIGILVHFGRLVLADLQPYPVVVAAAMRSTPAQDDAARDATELLMVPAGIVSVVDDPAGDWRPQVATGRVHSRAARVVPVRRDAEGGPVPGPAASALETAILLGTRPGYGPVGTASFQTAARHSEGRRVHWYLMEMAAAQRRDGVRPCQCRGEASD